MNSFILAGGKGTRFREETSLKPKPMIEIIGTPMVVHIINHYIYHDINKFTILAGTKIDYILNYFKNNFNTISSNEFKYKNSKILILDTGEDTMTGGRIKIGVEETKSEKFMVTYGDGISDVNIKKLEKFYNDNNYLGVVTSVRPPARFGRLKIENNEVTEFGEKNQADEGWINGGFFVFNSEILPYIKDEKTVFEKEPLENLSKSGKLGAFIHEGFWQCVDTIREKEILEKKLKTEGLDWM